MKTSLRRLYRLVLNLHPSEFRNQFGREMAFDFEDALHTHGAACLWRDVLWSLARQWSAQIFSSAPHPGFARRPSLLAGDYVMICDNTYKLLELGRGLAGSVAVLALSTVGLEGAPKAAIHLPLAYASSTPSTPQNGNPEMSPPVNAAAPCGALPEAADNQPSPELRLFHPSGPLPSYEVATIKPVDPNMASTMVKLPPGATLSPLSMRRYIMDAYAATYAAQIVGGPDWLNKDAYFIRGKIPDDLAAALKKMNSQDSHDQTRMMAQCLLGDRFHLKAHFETRVLPVYELVPAKAGLRLTAVPAPPEIKSGEPRPYPGDPLPPGTSMTALNSSGLRVLNARAIKLELLARIIGGDAGDRPIVNHTRFTGYFDVRDVTYAPLGDAAADTPPDAPSLAGALEKTLGLKLVPTKDPIEVLVIDSIERPSPN